MEEERPEHVVEDDQMDDPLPDPSVADLGTPENPIKVGELATHGSEFEEILDTCLPLQEEED